MEEWCVLINKKRKRKRNEGCRRNRANETAEEAERRREERNEKDRAIRSRKRANETAEEAERRREERNEKDRAIRSRKRANEMPEEAERRRKERNEKDRATKRKRANEMPEEAERRRKERNEKDRARRERQREKGREERRLKRMRLNANAEQRRSIECDWDITEDDLFERRRMIENENERAEFFKDIEQDPAKATLLWYLNAGYSRFGGTRMTNVECEEEKNAELKELEKEIWKEKLTETEEAALLTEYVQKHGYNAAIRCCGACGLKEPQRGGKVKYKKVCLDRMGYHHWPFVVNADDSAGDKRDVKMVSIPINKEWEVRQVNVWDAKSLYYSEALDKTFFLHPELVFKCHQAENFAEGEPAGEGDEFTFLCETCYASKLEPPERSLAAGVDFGDYERIHLERLNIHEQVILARMRLYSKFIKIRRNVGGRSDYTHCSIQAHAVLFEDDSVFVAADELFKPERLREAIKIQFVGPKGENDWLLKQTMNASTLLARPYVLYQWAVVLKEINSRCYSKLELPTIKEFTRRVKNANKHILESAVYSNSDHELRFEESIGADVAHVRSECRPRQDSNEEMDSNTDVGIQYAYVMRKGDAADPIEGNESVMLLHAVADAFDVNVEESANGNDYDSSSVASSVSSVSSSLSDESMSEPDDNQDPISYREAEPESEFDKTEYALCSAWPEVFLFGSGYNRAVANISPKERHHLLHQFTCHPGRNRQLLGYLYDARQRHETIAGVNASVKGRRKSIEKFASLYEQKSFTDDIKTALEEPDGEVAKRILKTLVPILNYSGRKTASGALELNETPSRILEMSRRYFSPNLFLTVAFDDVNNPLAYRVAQRIMKESSTFPLEGLTAAQLQHFIANETVEIDSYHHVIDCGYKARAMCAMDNPIAYVSEYKACMLDVLSTLLCLEPSTTKLRQDGNTIRKTKYFEDRGKGMIGHMLAFDAVTEEHKKGTLHFHLVGWGSLSAQLLQRAAGEDSLCKAIADVLDSQYRAALDTRSLQELAFRKTLKDMRVSVRGEMPKPPVLLDYVMQNERTIRTERDTFTAPINLKASTEDQGKRQNHHDPHDPRSCMEGFNGHTGCRYFKPSNLSDGTHATLLEADDEIDPETNKKTVGDIRTRTNIPSKVFNDRDSFDVRKKPDERLIVWELNRPKLPEEAALDPSSDTESMVTSLMKAVKELGLPELSKTVEDFLAESPNCITEMYNSVQDRLTKQGNGSVVEHCPMLSRCTGSHNNAQILGSSQQGKCAIFYTAGYLGKQKAKLLECLTILSKAKEHIEKFPSRANDRDTSSVRTVQHLLQRTLNQLNVLQEVSDYQVAASLMEHSIEMASDSFTYLRPASCLSFVLNQKAQEDAEQEMDRMFVAMNNELDEQEGKFLTDLGVDKNENMREFIIDDEEERKEEDDYGMYDTNGSDHEDDERKPGQPATSTRVHPDRHPFYVCPEMYASLGPAPIYTISRKFFGYPLASARKSCKTRAKPPLGTP